MPEKNAPVLQEMYNKRLTLVTGGMVGMYVAFAVIVCVMGPNTFGERAMQVLPIVLAVGGLVTLVTFIRCLRCKISLDEVGAEVGNPFGRGSSLRWDELHTAALVRYGLPNGEAVPVILLSTLEPEAVLTRAAYEHPQKHTQVRIPWTATRQRVVEHHLRMTLPEVQL